MPRLFLSACLACLAAHGRAFAWHVTPAVSPGIPAARGAARLGTCALRVSGDSGAGEQDPTRLSDFLQAIEKGAFDDRDDPLLFSLTVWSCHLPSCVVNVEMQKRRVEGRCGGYLFGACAHI